MIKFIVIDEDGDDHVLFETEDDTMTFTPDQIKLLLCFKDDVDFEVRSC